MIKTILIDLDDTLWATYLNHRDAFREMYISHHWDTLYPSFEQLHQHYAEYNDHLWSEYRAGRITKGELIIERFRKPLSLLPDIHMDHAVMAIHDEFVSRTSTKTQLMPGALELLQWMSSLYQVVILSNGFVEVQTKKITHSGLAPLIDHIVLSEEAGANKPSPIIFRHALDRCHARPSETIMIGDSWDADIVGAEGAGLSAIWYAPSHTELPTILRTPVYHVRHLDEIPTLLRRAMVPEATL